MSYTRSTLEDKTLALMEALICAINLNIRKAVFETDCKNLFDLISKKTIDWRIADLLVEICRIIAEHQNLYLMDTKREQQSHVPSCKGVGF